MNIESSTIVSHKFTIDMSHEELELVLIAIDSYISSPVKLENSRVDEATLRKAERLLPVFYNMLSEVAG